MEATKTFHSVTLGQFKVLAEKALLVFDAINNISAIGHETKLNAIKTKAQKAFKFDAIGSSTAINNVLLSIGIQPVDFVAYFQEISERLAVGRVQISNLDFFFFHPVFEILMVLDDARQGEHSYGIAISRLNNMSHAIWKDGMKILSDDGGKDFTNWKWCLEVARPNSDNPGIKLRIKPRYNACTCGLRMTEGLKIEKLHGQLTYTPIWECSCGLTKTRLTAN